MSQISCNTPFHPTYSETFPNRAIVFLQISQTNGYSDGAPREKNFFLFAPVRKDLAQKELAVTATRLR